MNKLLIICGPTATGKTKLALTLTKIFQGELVSADSRQVYKYMDSLTGKDIPHPLKPRITHLSVLFRSKIYRLPIYAINGVSLWLLDVVLPNEKFSVAHYKVLAEAVLADIKARGKLPIVVGGTGLYLDALTSYIETLSVPPNNKLRLALTNLRVSDLQKKLIDEDVEKWHQMNESDRSNPRRLIRAIEVAFWKRKHTSQPTKYYVPQSVLWIGLFAPMPALLTKIRKRVGDRWLEAVNEVKNLQKKRIMVLNSSLSTLGYKEITEYLSRNLSREEAQKRWVAVELSYAKRQMTWFKKRPSIFWFDIREPQFTRKVTDKIRSWYTQLNGKD